MTVYRVTPMSATKRGENCSERYIEPCSDKRGLMHLRDAPYKGHSQSSKPLNE